MEPSFVLARALVGSSFILPSGAGVIITYSNSYPCAIVYIVLLHFDIFQSYPSNAAIVAFLVKSSTSAMELDVA